MKNIQTLAMSLLFLGLLMVCISMRRTQKQLDEYKSRITPIVSCNDLNFTYKIFISRLKKIKSDTVQADDLYQPMVHSLSNGNKKDIYFYLITDFLRNEKNAGKIDQLKNEYLAQNKTIADFYTCYPSYNALGRSNIDTLITYYKNLENIVTRLREIKMEPTATEFILL